MNEEELFCKLFPEYAVNGKPLSPYFDLFESGYEQAENRIEELEATNKRISDECHKLVDSLEQKQKESTELEKKLTEKVTLESLDVVSRYVKQLEQEKCELLGIIQGKDKAMQDLQKENAELSMKRKAERKIFQGIVEKKTDQLTKAKELLNEFMRISKASDEDFEHDYSELIVEAENFLKESEVEK